MAFLNKKEDVIDLQLTQYGKYLVSQGKFKPIYYAFFDDDIIYDQRYATGSGLETQKNIETRIMENTPSLSTQYLFHSVDNLEMQDQFSRVGVEKDKLEQIPERHYTLNDPLSNSLMSSNKAPAFNITFQEGEINFSERVISGSVNDVFSIQRIPQINLKDVKIRVKSEEGYSPDDVSFKDGTYLSVEGGHILFQVEEDNSPISKENFDLDVYVIDDNNKIQYPLYFTERKEMVRGGLLLDKEEVMQNTVLEAGPDDVRYYFDLLTDSDAEAYLPEQPETPEENKKKRRRRGRNRSGGRGGSTGGGSGY